MDINNVKLLFLFNYIFICIFNIYTGHTDAYFSRPYSQISLCAPTSLIIRFQENKIYTQSFTYCQIRKYNRLKIVQHLILHYFLALTLSSLTPS